MYWLSVFIGILEQSRFQMSFMSDDELKIICYDESKMRQVIALFSEFYNPEFPRIKLFNCQTRTCLLLSKP